MILAPYSVVWAFVLITIVLINLGLAWLVFPAPIARRFRRLWISDGVALWLTLTAGYHSLSLLRPAFGAVLDDPTGVRALWGALAFYLVVRVIPLPRRVGRGGQATLGLALAVAIWGWSIGAGYGFIARMEADRHLLETRPDLTLRPVAGAYAPLARVAFFDRVNRQDRELLERILLPLREGKPLEPGLDSLARLELVPQAIIYYDLELRLLNAYQVLQILLLAGVLAAWGFGEQLPGPREEPVNR